MIEVPDLTVPHVGIAERAFVLYPLSEIAPHVTVPGKGKISVLLQQCPRSGLDRLA
jgi:2-amino-4-hydroxy-6-hydroxymethyldihydropteridine diphosphokinase